MTFATFLLASCSQDEPLSKGNIPENTLKSQTSEFSISPEEAVEIASVCMNEFSPQTRAENRKVSKIVMLSDKAKSAATRSSNSQPIEYYLINYQDEGGFAVVSNDSRVPVLRAISPEGNLEISDIQSNKALSSFFDSMPYRIDPDSIIVVGPVHPWNPGPNNPKLKVEVAPILTRSVQTWNIFNPFNSQLNGNCVSCVQLSCAMIMSHLEWPISYTGHIYDWQDIKNNHSSNSLALLIKDLGTYNNLCVSYTPTASVAAFDDCVKTFENFGYQKPTFEKFSISAVMSRLYKNEPVLIDGQNLSYPNSYQTWVIDGLCSETGLGAIIAPNQPETKVYYLHCVWGKGGKGNGYYNFDNSTVGNNPRHTEDYESMEGVGAEFSNWKIIYNFNKK